MIDTDKYEGHTEDIGRWQMMGRSLPHWANKKDEQLVRDAVYLLEEVKRLRGGIRYVLNECWPNATTMMKKLKEMMEVGTEVKGPD